MAIEYKTEGKITIECAKGNASPIAVTWMVDDTSVKLHGGGSHITLSKSQLLALADFALSISHDLQPGRTREA